MLPLLSFADTGAVKDLVVVVNNFTNEELLVFLYPDQLVGERICLHLCLEEGWKLGTEEIKRCLGK